MAGKHSMDDNEVPKAFRKTEVNNNTEEFYNGGKRERNMSSGHICVIRHIKRLMKS